MRHGLSGLIVIGTFLLVATQNAHAQQKTRSVTYTFQRPSFVNVQWQAETAVQNSPTPNELAPEANTSAVQENPFNAPPSLPAKAIPSSVGSAIFNAGNSSTNLPQPPTAQQLQNPSGAYQFSHSGMNSGGYITQNTYLGRQFDNWNNIRQQPSTLDAFQTFNRTQPPSNSGAYVSPNSYFGQGFSQWSNLSTGSAVPNHLGGYTYQQ